MGSHGREVAMLGESIHDDKIVVLPLDGGIPMMKSIDSKCQILPGMGNDYNKP